LNDTPKVTCGNCKSFKPFSKEHANEGYCDGPNASVNVYFGTNWRQNSRLRDSLRYCASFDSKNIASNVDENSRGEKQA
jgi:hypothetical protein